MKEQIRTGSLLLCALWALALLWATLAPRQIVHAQLPPRPTLTPTPTGSDTAEPVRIRLLAGPDYANTWVLVQWQGGLGDWNDVDGWLGQIETLADGQLGKRWRVLPKDYDTGPFRWVILDAPGGAILAASAPFYLPNPSAPLGEVQELMTIRGE